MIKQTLFFSTPVCLSLKNYQIVISWKDCDDKITRPIEDIGCVVLENQMISITLPLLNELVKNNVAVILCDNKMMPTSMLQNLDANTTQAESLKFQLAVTDPMKKQVWKQIIESKIKNQAAVLALAGKTIPIYLGSQSLSIVRISTLYIIIIRLENIFILSGKS